MALTVSQLAKLAGVSVRTLHHYDEVGLLRPSGRTQAGYRLYEEKELQRLQQILFFRELEFPLEEILRIMNDPEFDVREALRMQRELLQERGRRVQVLIAAVDAAINAQERGTTMTPEERFEVFGDFKPEEYAEEVEQRWGNTEAYRESRRRVAKYGKQDWLKVKDESARNVQRFVELMDANVPADSPEAKQAAEEHRQHISRWFYDCGYDLHRGLAEMYVADERFTRHYDQHRKGLAAYLRDAILANAAGK